MNDFPIRYRRIQRVFLQTFHPQRLLDFYQALGLPPLDSPKQTVFGVQIGQSELHIVPPAPDFAAGNLREVRGDGHISQFEVEVDEGSDLRRCAEQIRRAGGRILKEPWQEASTGCWNLLALDIDGNCFSIASFVEALQERLLGQLQGLANVGADSALGMAFRAVPRHNFLPGRPLEEVYVNQAIMTRQEGESLSSCSQPGVVAAMLNQAGLGIGDNVLEIGSGTGWNAALMGHLVGSQGFVTTIDLDCETAEFARSNLARLGVDNVEVICGEGGLGFEPRAPYDGIMATAQMPDLSPHLVRQLRQGGRLVVPQWFNTAQFSVAYEKIDDSSDILASRSVLRCGFMPLRGEFSGPISRLDSGPLTVHVRSGLALDLDAVQAMLATPPREVAVPSLSGEWDNRFLEYAALTGEPLARFHIASASNYIHPYCFVTSRGSFALLDTTWNSDREVEVPNSCFHVYGDDSVVAHIEEVAARWVAAGRPGLDEAEIVVAPIDSWEKEAQSTLIQQQWMGYQVTFRTP